jgi:hypothetical protein
LKKRHPDLADSDRILGGSGLYSEDFASLRRRCIVRKAIPETMFTSRDQPRLSVLQNWVLDNSVTEIEMNERQFWSFVSVQPVAEKPWTTFMGRLLHVSDMPADS